MRGGGSIYMPATNIGVKGSETGAKMAYSGHLDEVGADLGNPGVKVGGAGIGAGNSQRAPGIIPGHTRTGYWEHLGSEPGIVGVAPGIPGAGSGAPNLEPTSGFFFLLLFQASVLLGVGLRASSLVSVLIAVNLA